jgi:radical SAM protein with 4Fe4S-binding SPASM domain
MDARAKSRGELSTEEIKGTLDKLAALNNNLMLILTGGEPMLRPDIFQIISHAASLGFLTVLGTNGTLLDSDSIDALKRAGLKGMGVSVDSPEPDHHDIFRGFSGAWELAVSALKTARAAGIETQLDVTLTDDNIEGIDRFIELGVSLKARAVNFFFLVCTGRAMETAISTTGYDSAIALIAARSMSEKRLMVRARCAPHVNKSLYEAGHNVSASTRGCLAARSYMRIDPTGNVTPCPYMPMTLGNVRQRGIDDIWSASAELQSMRGADYGGRCGRCEFKEVCGGCRARALARRGDFMAEDDLCTYNPDGTRSLTFGRDNASDPVDNIATLQWDDDAKARIERVPLFMKKVVVAIVEKKARERGITLIDTAFIDEVKAFGMPGAGK